MKITTGQKYLITTDGWFIAPDGISYQAVFGTVNSIFSSEDTLGIKTNSKSTNWYVSIGNMLLAGCQVRYAIQTDQVSFEPAIIEIDHVGRRFAGKNATSRIYNANGAPES